MAKPEIPEATLLIYNEIEWDRLLKNRDPNAQPPAALVEQAKRTGARRKKIVRGEEGFFMNRSVLPSNFRVPEHSHDHSELLVVLRGGCKFDDIGELGPDDSIVIRANYRYGFTCGPDGMEFLTIRFGEARVSLTE